jgi:hypothetical protein
MATSDEDEDSSNEDEEAQQEEAPLDIIPKKQTSIKSLLLFCPPEKAGAWSCLVSSPERQELTKERLMLVATLAELEADKKDQQEANNKKKENAKRNKVIKARLEAEINQENFKRWRPMALIRSRSQIELSFSSTTTRSK